MRHEDIPRGPAPHGPAPPGEGQNIENSRSEQEVLT